MLIAVVIAAIVIAGVIIYRSWLSPNRLQVDPHAREEIEKAKRR